MAQWKSALPYGLSDDMGFDRGTSCLGPSPLPGSIWHAECGGRSSFDSAIRGLEAEIANAGAHLVIDGEARRTYATLVRCMADDLAGGALAGLACGPGAPVCVTVGAFVGGALAAFGIDWLW